MAGSDVDFDAAGTRADLRGAMLMGLPQDTVARPIFRFPKTETFTVPVDEGNEPLDPAAPPTTVTQRPDITCGPANNQVVCTWEPQGTKARPVESVLGTFDPDRLLVTMLDVDWVKVEGFRFMLFSGDAYKYEKEVPHQGLFDLTVHQISVIATDES